MLPGWRRLRVATSRSARLRAGPQAAIDFVGIAPDVRLPRDSATGDAAIAFALGRAATRRTVGGEVRGANPRHAAAVQTATDPPPDPAAEVRP